MPIDIRKVTAGFLCVGVSLPAGVAGVVAASMNGSLGQIATAMAIAGSSGLVIVSSLGLVVYVGYRKYMPHDPHNVFKRDADPEAQVLTPLPTPPLTVVPITFSTEPRTPSNSVSHMPRRNNSNDSQLEQHESIPKLPTPRSSIIKPA